MPVLQCRAGFIYYNNAWKDQLTSYDNKAITYDASGNPTSYLGATLTWSRGRLLTKYVNGSTTVDIQYDARGFKKSSTKVMGTITSDREYIYNDDGRLLYDRVNTFDRYYLYGQDGIVGFEEDGVVYTYRKNLFGDVTAIYQGTSKVAEYVYDAWGNCTITTNVNGFGTRNAIRYRGYYWDNDLNMYYLLTRYYDPQTGRFINADTPEYLDPKTINGLNLYSYCNNNPIMNVDPTGHMALSQDTISDIISAVVIILGVVIVAWMNGSFSKIENPTDGNGLDISFDPNTTPEPVLEGPKLDEYGLRVINVALSARRCDMYLNSNKSRSFYLSLGNLSAFLGAYFDYENAWGMNLGGEISANLLEVGFDGQYIDFSFSFFGIGASAKIKNCKPEAGLDGPKYPGFDFSIDPIKIAQDMVNYFRTR